MNKMYFPNLLGGNIPYFNQKVPTFLSLTTTLGIYQYHILSSNIFFLPSDQIHDDPCAFNMHGVLLEHQELYGQAEKAYKRSVALISFWVVLLY